MQRVPAGLGWRDLKQSTKHVDLSGEGLRTRVQFPPAPPLLKPQLFSVGAFSRSIVPIPACLRILVRMPADFASCPLGPFPGTFRSLLAILLSGLALRAWPEVRKGFNHHP